MTGPREPLAAAARQLVDSSRYMTLGTADESGLPWVSPVWFAPVGYREFFWVSDPGARHSRNIAVRPEVSIVIFDSHVSEKDANALYMAAVAEQPSGAELDRGMAVFSARSAEQGLPVWTRENVTGEARHRLYRATATEQFVLGPHDQRLPVVVA